VCLSMCVYVCVCLNVWKMMFWCGGCIHKIGKVGGWAVWVFKWVCVCVCLYVWFC
jgi:hypothetical protein